jgi:hypothetical protein
MEGQRAVMFEGEKSPAAVGNESLYPLNHGEQGLSYDNEEKLVSGDKDPLLTLVEEPVAVTRMDEEKGAIPEEARSMLTPLELRTKNTPESNDEKSEVAVSPSQIGTIKEINEGAKEVTVMNTSELQNQEAVQAKITGSGSEPMPAEKAKLTPAEPVLNEVESETKQIASSEDDAKDGNSEGILDIFREEEKEANDFYFQTLEEVGMDSLLGEANQVFKEINLRRSKTT